MIKIALVLQLLISLQAIANPFEKISPFAEVSCASIEHDLMVNVSHDGFSFLENGSQVVKDYPAKEINFRQELPPDIDEMFLQIRGCDDRIEQYEEITPFKQNLSFAQKGDDNFEFPGIGNIRTISGLFDCKLISRKIRACN